MEQKTPFEDLTQQQMADLADVICKQLEVQQQVLGVASNYLKAVFEHLQQSTRVE